MTWTTSRNNLFCQRQCNIVQTWWRKQEIKVATFMCVWYVSFISVYTVHCIPPLLPKDAFSDQSFGFSELSCLNTFILYVLILVFCWIEEHNFVRSRLNTVNPILHHLVVCEEKKIKEMWYLSIMSAFRTHTASKMLSWKLSLLLRKMRRRNELVSACKEKQYLSVYSISSLFIDNHVLLL